MTVSGKSVPAGRHKKYVALYEDILGKSMDGITYQLIKDSLPIKPCIVSPNVAESDRPFSESMVRFNHVSTPVNVTRNRTW